MGGRNASLLSWLFTPGGFSTDALRFIQSVSLSVSWHAVEKRKEKGGMEDHLNKPGNHVVSFWKCCLIVWFKSFTWVYRGWHVGHNSTPPPLPFIARIYYRGKRSICRRQGKEILSPRVPIAFSSLQILVSPYTVYFCNFMG